MSDAWIGGATAIAGVVVGIVAESWRARTSFRRERSWDLFREDLRRLEQVYEALEEVRDCYNETTVPILANLVGGPLPPTSQERRKVPWARLRMLVHLYAPSLKPHLDVVEKAGPALGEMAAKSLLAASSDRDRNLKWGDAIMQASRQLDAAINSMCDELIAKARSLTDNAAAQAGYAHPKFPPRGHAS